MVKPIGFRNHRTADRLSNSGTRDVPGICPVNAWKDDYSPSSLGRHGEIG